MHLYVVKYSEYKQTHQCKHYLAMRLAESCFESSLNLVPIINVLLKSLEYPFLLLSIKKSQMNAPPMIIQC